MKSKDSRSHQVISRREFINASAMAAGAVLADGPAHGLLAVRRGGGPGTNLAAAATWSLPGKVRCRMQIPRDFGDQCRWHHDCRR